MDKIQKITLRDVIPVVFADEKDSAAISGSQVWLADLTFDRGKFYSVNAASGMGKTSLCSFIFGLRSDFQGEISFDGKNSSQLTSRDWAELRSRHIAYVPQDLDLFPQLTAIENIMLKNSLTDCRSESEIRQMLCALGLESRADTQAAYLSIGQRQRVAIIRALCQPFDFILLDEPVSHLDRQNNQLCAKMVVETADRNGASVISTSVGNPLALPDDRITHIKL